MQLEKNKQNHESNNKANNIASKNGTTQHVCNKQENTLATNSVITSSQKKLPGSYLQSKPRKNTITATATVPASDWVTNCTPLQKSCGAADIYMVPEVSTHFLEWSAFWRTFWKGPLSGALLVALFFCPLSLCRKAKNMAKISDKQCDT